MSRSIAVEHNGTTYIGKIATIRSTRLGYEDHGIFTAMLDLDMGGSNIGFGGYALDQPQDREKTYDRKRIGTAFGLDHIIKLIEVVGAGTWENLTGCRVVALFEAEWGMCYGLANLTDESKVFIAKEHAESWKNKTA